MSSPAEKRHIRTSITDPDCILVEIPGHSFYLSKFDANVLHAYLGVDLEQMARDEEDARDPDAFRGDEEAMQEFRTSEALTLRGERT